MIKNYLVALLVCTSISAFAVDSHARLDINGIVGKVKLTLNQKPAKGVGYNPSWLKVGKDYFIYTLSARLKSDDWEDFEIAFTPDKDGFVILNLKGMYYKPKGKKKNIAVWTCWDNIVIEGAEIVNGTFDKLDKNGKPEGWITKPENLISKDGNKYIKVWFNSAATQKIKVKKDQKVTIKAKVRKL
ncbi:MAG: hypothetical protein L3J71_04605 [Victivallaceae bacterium]|nr:hypothetical protein [Victivallaceae bacterium]